MDSTHYDPTKLVTARQLRQETQEQVATALNVNRQTIYRAEAGTHVSMRILGKMCAYYGIPVTTLIVPHPVNVANA